MQKSREDTIKAIDVSLLDEVKRRDIMPVLQKYGYSLMIKYLMGGKASPFSSIIRYEETALAVLSESAIQFIEKKKFK